MPSTTIVTPTTPTFQAQIAPTVLASGGIGTVTTLDLNNAKGAMVYVQIGRRVATALTRAGKLVCRRTDNNTLVLPFSAYDTETVSATTAAASSTVASGGAAASNSVTLASATGFSIGDLICLHADDTSGDRMETACILAISTNTLTLDRNLRVTHNVNDRVTNLATVRPMWLPGGDIWEIYPANNSGQSLVYRVDVAIQPSDTGVTI